VSLDPADRVDGCDDYRHFSTLLSWGAGQSLMIGE
jgi:hypothetical protein